MYAYTSETRRGFFAGVHALNDQACISTDLPCHSRIASFLYTFYLARFLPNTAVNRHSLRPYLVLGNKLQSGETGHPSLPLGQAMQHPVCGVLKNSPSTH
jgi:hypothetical protein